uniref:Leafy cotyledon 1 n=1 Tax=Pseudotsuga menziesii TaxID=3357 RepID=E3P6R9_PSEMZ|nr:leafy cotyledon 1 [Pseudotsuga menziesii]
MMSEVGSPTSQDSRNSEDGDRENCVVREQDRFMPIANVIRIMRKVLPTHAKISDDAKETIQECVSEYISFITSEANERCQKEQRKTITAEDVLWAMNKLGFDDYVEPLTTYLQKYREIEGDHRGSIRGEPLPKKEMNALGNLSVGFQMTHPVVYGTSGMGYYKDSVTSSNINYDPYAQYK